MFFLLFISLSLSLHISFSLSPCYNHMNKVLTWWPNKKNRRHFFAQFQKTQSCLRMVFIFMYTVIGSVQTFLWKRKTWGKAHIYSITHVDPHLHTPSPSDTYEHKYTHLCSAGSGRTSPPTGRKCKSGLYANKTNIDSSTDWTWCFSSEVK